MATQKNMTINVDICTGCRLCELICSLVKERESNPAKSRIHNEFYLMEGMRVPRVCINCVDPACVTSCPTEALVKNNVTGLVTLDDDACNNCLACVEACKYGSIRLTPDDVIIKCDTCGGDPECVKICETKAITFADRKPQTLTQARKGVAKWAEVKKTEEVLA